MIYFIRNPENDLVKIGFSDSVLTRLEDLRRIHGKEIFIQCLADGDMKKEKAFHGLYSHLRVEKEWFTWSDDMMAHNNVELVPVKATPQGVTVSIYIEAELKVKLEEMARKDNRSLSKMIGVILHQTVSKTI